MGALLNNRWVEFSIRWILGLTFIVACYHKIAEPASFAKIIYGYGLLPHITINIVAIVLPFLELVTGLSLLLNFYRKAAAIIAGVMLTAFIIAISINLARQHEFECGCFSFGSENPLTGTKFLLTRDILLLSFCMYLFRYNGSIFPKRTLHE